MAKKRKAKAKKKTTTSSVKFSVSPDQVGDLETTNFSPKTNLTAREKKAIIEKEVFCRSCQADGKRVLAAKVNDEGEPLCRIHGKNL